MKSTMITLPGFIVSLFMLMLMAGCSGSGSGTVANSAAGTSSATGAAIAKLVWQEAPRATATKAAAPAGVTTVRVIVSAAGLLSMQQDYPAAAGGGTISGIPVGISTFTFQGLDASGAVTHQGVVNNVSIIAGQTTDLGTVVMQSVTPIASGVTLLPKTGQTTSYAAGDDGDLEKGAAWPDPRFTDNSNGTVTDNLTGLIWLKNANCTDTAGGIAKANGYLVWADALTWSNSLASGVCGLTDGSSAGQWRLPNIVELESLVDAEQYGPALPGGHPFSNVRSGNYWSSSTYAGNTDGAWYVGVYYGYVNDGSKGSDGYVWPVRSGQ